MLSDTLEKELKKIDKITYFFSNVPKKKNSQDHLFR